MADKTRITRDEALAYHLEPSPGKIDISASTPMATQRDLSLAYSPGVAVPCEVIAENPETAYDYTTKGNLVAVISNGTAVLGLGNLGALASKPVMEGKAVLFKRFADINSIDIELDTEDVDEFVNAVRLMGPSFGGINLEDIKAPECFMIESRLKEIMDIPVFHDDQHGTAVICAAGLINALHLSGKKIEDCRIVLNGAGAAGIACIELLKAMGARHENCIVCDTKGVIWQGRTEGMNQWKSAHAVKTELRTLEEAMVGADVFLGVSVKGAVTQDMVKSMADNPVIFAMANPDPEITPEEAHEVRVDAIVATGRSDYPNQVNNVLGFPYLFRGALGYSRPRHQRPDEDRLRRCARRAGAGGRARRGRHGLWPQAELRARLHHSNALRPAPDLHGPAGGGAGRDGYRRIAPSDHRPRRLCQDPARADGSDQFDPAGDLCPRPQRAGADDLRRGRRCARVAGRRGLSAERSGQGAGRRARGGCEGKAGKRGSWRRGAGIAGRQRREHHASGELQGIPLRRLQRKGYDRHDVHRLAARDRHAFSALMLAHGHGDALVTGATRKSAHVLELIGKVFDVSAQDGAVGITALLHKGRIVLIGDTLVNEWPDDRDLALIAERGAHVARELGLEPRVAFVSFSTFGYPVSERAVKMGRAPLVLDGKGVDFEYDGEMTVDVAINPAVMEQYPFCRLTGPANVLVVPARHSASISVKLMQEMAGATVIGPILTGLPRPVQIASNVSTANDILNMAVMAACEIGRT
jgi:malate dehydrogenase (oxaloacetate-decarboxylating)(NADP+)